MVIDPKEPFHLVSGMKGALIVLVFALLVFTWISKLMQDRLDQCIQQIDESMVGGDPGGYPYAGEYLGN